MQDWARERLGLDELASLAQKKEVPVHGHTLFYYLGGMTLFLFSVQVATGILLLLYYRPSSSRGVRERAVHDGGRPVRLAHPLDPLLGRESLRRRRRRAPVRVFFLKAYRAPREATWITGAVLLFLTMGFGFSGYLLPWNTLSYFATKVGTDVPAQIPGIGHFSRASCAAARTSPARPSRASTASTSRSCRR